MVSLLEGSLASRSKSACIVGSASVSTLLSVDEVSFPEIESRGLSYKEELGSLFPGLSSVVGLDIFMELLMLVVPFGRPKGE